MTTKKPTKKLTWDKKGLKKPSAIFKEPPELDIDDEAVKEIVREAIKLLEWHQVRHLWYSQEWYPCSKEVRDIIDLYQKNSLKNIGWLINDIEALKETNLIFTTLMTTVWVLAGIIIWLIIYIS